MIFNKINAISFTFIIFIVLCSFLVASAENEGSIANKEITAQRGTINVNPERRTDADLDHCPSGVSRNDLPLAAPDLGDLEAGTFCCSNATSTGGTGCVEIGSSDFCTRFKIDCAGNTTLDPDGNLRCW